jgi:hypothetical protein
LSAPAQPLAEERLATVSFVGQETAELDMQAVMEEDPEAADGGSPVGPIADGPPHAAYSGAPHAEEDLGSGLPSEPDLESAPEDVSGQERLTFE